VATVPVTIRAVGVFRDERPVSLELAPEQARASRGWPPKKERRAREDYPFVVGTRPARGVPRRRTSSAAVRTPFNISRACSRKTSPAAESVIPRGVRTKSAAPSSSSSRLICRLTAGCATRRAKAARPTCRSFATATKYSIWARLTGAVYSERGRVRDPIGIGFPSRGRTRFDS
jgi:hypothetical protein